MNMKTKCGTGGLLFLVLFVSTANALPVGTNLLTDGDFENITTADFVHSDFSASTGPFNTWLTQPLNWVVQANGGPDGAGDQYAGHLTNGVRLFQGIQSGSAPIGTELELSFDFIYQTGFTGISNSSVHVFGLNSSDPDIEVQAPFNNPGTTLFSAALTPPLIADWTAFSATFTLPALYDAIAVVFTANAFGTNTQGLRGIDNASLTVTPEPASLLMLGASLLGLGVRRKLSGCSKA